jgi:IS5 family transposase
MLRIPYVQLWSNYSHPAMEEKLHDMPIYGRFVGLDAGASRLRGESTILRFRHFLQEFGLAKIVLAEVKATLRSTELLTKNGTPIDVILILAPRSTTKDSGTRNPQMHQTKKINQFYFGMKPHIGVDAESGLVHTLLKTPANTPDVKQTQDLPHGQETGVFADSGHRGIGKREEPKDFEVTLQIAMMSTKRRALNLELVSGQLRNVSEKIKASIRAKVRRAFRIITCQFGFTKVRYRGPTKNTARLNTLFALSDLKMVREHLLHGPTAKISTICLVSM